MVSKKVYYQHLFKGLIGEIESFNDDGSETDAQGILDRILLLDKDSKKELLLKKVQSNKNFVKLFNVMLTKEIDLLQNNLK